MFDERNRLLSNYTLSLFCKIDVLPESVTIPECRLSDDLLLLESQTFTDAIISSGGKELRADKVVLATRSPMFAAVFKCNVEEKQKTE